MSISSTVRQREWREKNIERAREHARNWYYRKRQDPEFKKRLADRARSRRESERQKRLAAKAALPILPVPSPEELAERRRLYHREWSTRNKGKIAVAGKRSRERNLTKVRARVTAFNQLRGKEYSKRYRETNPEKRRESLALYRTTHAEQERLRAKAYSQTDRGRIVINAKAAARRFSKAKATPSWVNVDAVLEVYAQCRALSSETGVRHHVDHIVPLRSKLVCGLHCEANLQVLPKSENLKKCNRTWPDMP